MYWGERKTRRKTIMIRFDYEPSVEHLGTHRKLKIGEVVPWTCLLRYLCRRSAPALVPTLRWQVPSISFQPHLLRMFFGALPLFKLLLAATTFFFLLGLHLICL